MGKSKKQYQQDYREKNTLKSCYVSWGKILIPFGPSRASKHKMVYHLPAGIEVESAFSALLKMVEVYKSLGLDVGTDEPIPQYETLILYGRYE